MSIAEPIKRDPHRPSVPIGPEQLPPPDPRLGGGLDRQPPTETIPVERHPAGTEGGQGGRFR